MVFIQNLRLELLLCKVRSADAFTEALKLAICELTVKEHVKLSEDFLNCCL